MKFTDLIISDKRRNGPGIRKKLKSRSGISLAEMLLCVILLGMVTSMGVMGLKFAYSATDDLQTEAKAWEVGSTVLSRIEGELKEAGSKLFYMKGSDQTTDMIGFDNEEGIPVSVSCVNPDTGAADQYLWIYYYPTKISGSDTASSAWSFDSKMYGGYQIQDLSFTRLQKSAEDPLTIRIGLTLVSKTGKTFEMSRIVGCNNLKNSAVITGAEEWETHASETAGSQKG